MDILLGHIGHFEIVDVAHAGHIDPARGDVGGNQNGGRSLAEGAQRSGTLRLALVAVDCGRIDPGGVEVAHNTVCAMLGPGEHQCALNLAIGEPGFQAQCQQRLLFGLVHMGDELIDPLGCGGLRSYFDADRIVDELAAKLGDRLGHGGREEQALTLLGEHVGNALERHDKAKIHHLVGLVEHEDLDIAQRQRALIDQIEQAAGGGNKDVGSANQCARLLTDGDAAEHDLNRKVEVFGIAAEVLGDLGGELAGWRKHQHPARGVLARLGVGRKPMERGQRKGCGFAGAGLGDTQDVTALEQRRNGLALDRGGIGIALGFKRTEQRLGEAKVGKIGHGILSI